MLVPCDLLEAPGELDVVVDVGRAVHLVDCGHAGGRELRLVELGGEDRDRVHSLEVLLRLLLVVVVGAVVLLVVLLALGVLLVILALVLVSQDVVHPLGIPGEKGVLCSSGETRKPSAPRARAAPSGSSLSAARASPTSSSTTSCCTAPSPAALA